VAINTINDLRVENARLKNNQLALFTENNNYKLRDSLNAMSITQLELKLSELEKYRQNDLQLIKDLKISKSSLERIIDINTQSINRYKALLRDSVVRDTIINRIDTIKCFNYKSIWTDISGCIHKDTTYLQIKNRESLTAVESLEKKKFWFVKLPISIFGYKNRKLDIISNGISLRYGQVFLQPPIMVDYQK
jgi:hypothetical protein